MPEAHNEIHAAVERVLPAGTETTATVDGDVVVIVARWQQPGAAGRCGFSPEARERLYDCVAAATGRPIAGFIFDELAGAEALALFLLGGAGSSTELHGVPARTRLEAALSRVRAGRTGRAG